MAQRRGSVRAGQSGFNFIELIVIMAIMGMLAVFGLPAILAMGERAKLQSTAREAASVLRLARMEAVKRSMTTAVVPDFTRRELVAFVDADGDRVLDATEITISTTRMPTGVELWGPTDVAAGGANASIFPEVDGDGIRAVQFSSMGAARANGAFRFKGKAENFIEVRVDPAATGRVSVQKWFGGDADENWYEQGEGGNGWEWYEEGDTPVPPS
jgi:type II secretory pathway pseudopilin PulG